MTPDRLRAYVAILTRDVVPPAVGTYLIVTLGGDIQPFHLPLLAGLFGIPLVAPRSKNGEAT